MRKHITQFRQETLQLHEDATTQVFMMLTSINYGFDIKLLEVFNNIMSKA